MALSLQGLNMKAVRLFGTSGIVLVDWPNANQGKLLASDGAADDWFGHSVAISGDGNTVMVGSPRDDDNGLSAGSTYIYRWNGSGWLQTKLLASDGAAGDEFGFSVSMSADGNTVVVGAPFDDDNGNAAGSAYVYAWNGTSWAETKLTASDGAGSDWFGHSVGMAGDGTAVVVGAYGDDDAGSQSGSAYVFRRSGASWPQQAKLTASDAAANDWFGYSVSMAANGNRVVVGASAAVNGGVNTGSAYVFDWDGAWDAGTEVLALDGAAGDRFGDAVSMAGDGNSVVVTAPLDDDLGIGSGAAYVFRRNGSSWTQEAKLLASDGMADAMFGDAVAMADDGNSAVVGASADSGAASQAGAAYVYQWDGSTWSQSRKLIADDAGAGDTFGAAVALSGDGTAIVAGAFREDEQASNAGAAYVFRAL